jgi:glycosyltransferase involved in cell wall biosynthesis
MNIAIHASDLDHDRLDGTRVYLFNMLKNFGKLDQKNSFLIYHQDEFNPQLVPPPFSNYMVKKIPFPLMWTQTRFAFEIFRDAPDVLWMPVHNIPICRKKNLKVVVTIHDLAFKIFPDYFTKKDLTKLNKLSDLAISAADHIIAVSYSTKNDILKFYPQINTDKITVVYHGFDPELFQREISQNESEKVLSKFKIPASPAGRQNSKFILYVGAIQPRKNLEVLIDAFEKIKEKNPELKLVFAGAPAWKYQETLDKIATSKFSDDIIVTGNLDFEKISILYQNAKMFVFPSLYEGFGIPVLEAMAAKTPVILASNSSLMEAGGEAALYFETENSANLANCMQKIIEDCEFEKKLIQQGLDHVKSFSWEKCARETLDILRSA